jgi:hypothetical protein
MSFSKKKSPCGKPVGQRKVVNPLQSTDFSKTDAKIPFPDKYPSSSNNFYAKFN